MTAPSVQTGLPQAANRSRSVNPVPRNVSGKQTIRHATLFQSQETFQRSGEGCRSEAEESQDLHYYRCHLDGHHSMVGS